MPGIGRAVALGFGGRSALSKLLAQSRLWIDSEVGLTPRVVGPLTYVAARADRAGNFPVSQGVAASQPLADGPGDVFDGVNDHLTTTLVDLADLRFMHEAMTIYLALNRTDTGTATRIIETAGGVTTASFGFSIRSDPATADALHVYVLNGSGSSRAINDGGNAGSLPVGKNIVTFGFDASTYLARVGGASVGIGGSTGALAAATDPDGQLTIGGPLTDFGGAIYEVLAFSGLHSISQIEQIEAYLGRWL